MVRSRRLGVSRVAVQSGVAGCFPDGKELSYHAGDRATAATCVQPQIVVGFEMTTRQDQRSACRVTAYSSKAATSGIIITCSLGTIVITCQGHT